jgi:hypothetical protein
VQKGNRAAPFLAVTFPPAISSLFAAKLNQRALPKLECNLFIFPLQIGRRCVLQAYTRKWLYFKPVPDFLQ